MLAQQAQQQQQHGGFQGLGGQFASSSNIYSGQPVAQAQTPQEYQLQYQPQIARPVSRQAPPVYARPQPQRKEEDLEEYDVSKTQTCCTYFKIISVECFSGLY